MQVSLEGKVALVTGGSKGIGFAIASSYAAAGAKVMLSSRKLDQLAAAASGLLSLARGTAHLLAAGSLTQTILEMSKGYLFVSSVGPGAALAVYAESRCDIGLVGYEMTMLAARVGHALSPAPRTSAGS